MISLSHKAKQYLLIVLKVLILGATLWYIHYKISQAPIGLQSLIQSVRKSTSMKCLLFIGFLCLLLGSINWLLEILKWKVLASRVQLISFKTATQQSLSAHTIGLLTPNRIGDYGAKAMFFKPEKRKKILVLNFLGNGMQLLSTLLFGIIGIVITVSSYSIPIKPTNVILTIIVIVLFILLGYLFKERELLVKGFSLKNLWHFFRELPPTFNLKIGLLSFLRYLVFSTLFYLVLQFLGAETKVTETAPLIFTMYLLVSITPTLFILDVIVRGGIAVWLFSLLGVAEVLVLCSVLIMWLLNFALPAIIGNLIFIQYKPKSL